MARRVLIVDDDEATRFVLTRFARSEGLVPIEVADGTEIWTGLGTNDVALVVLDLRMPGMNGWEVIRRIRGRFHASPEHRPHGPSWTPPKILAISGEGGEAVRDFVLRLGADAFLEKPIDLDTLRTTVRALLGSTPPLGPRRAS